MQANVSLAPYTYAKIGGPAEYLVVASSKAELVTAIQTAILQKMPYRVLGGGSNILIADAGLPGLTVINRSSQISLHVPHQNQVTVDSGVIVNQLVNTVTKAGLGGLEEFLGIPGTVGGAIFNNSHYLQKLIGQFVLSVEMLDETGSIRQLSQAECLFQYDFSIFHTKPYIILSAILSLSPGDATKLQAAALAALKRRKDTQPLEFPSSGCVFKNPDPQNGQFAGKLIDESGCKGMTVGGAKVSEKHASFIINTGSATASDYAVLAEKVRNQVAKSFGIRLDYEIIRLGEFENNKK